MSDLVYVHARNKSRVETCNLKLTEEIEEMFQDDFVMFVWAYFDPKGNLNIIERREKPNDWR
ncbi:MAG: hypothetical protein IM536_05460 [Pseudanabaena sp. M34BS1SP1A06MG]|nr:hypothetical protein [Pseudanabaena sp. M34BS1SP1A06MG]